MTLQTSPFVDFDIQIERFGENGYIVIAESSDGRNGRGAFQLPFSSEVLKDHLQHLQRSLIRHSKPFASRSVRPSSEKTVQEIASDEKTVQEIGQALFESLLPVDIRSLYDTTRRQAFEDNKGIRLRLRIEPAELVSLPWEFLYDIRERAYICRQTDMALIRFPEVSHAISTLTVDGPLRVLAMISNPIDLSELSTEREKERMEKALTQLIDKGRVELEWVQSGHWRELQRALRNGPWHMFHYIGHGDFDKATGKGLVYFEDEARKSQPVAAEGLADLLSGYRSLLRFVFLNACLGAATDGGDKFASTAATLIQRGIPAVLAMQYEITDEAAIELGRAFYEGIAAGLPVDVAVTEARQSIYFTIPDSMEWGTPVLYSRAASGPLFNVDFSNVSSSLLIRNETQAQLEETDPEWKYLKSIENSTYARKKIVYTDLDTIVAPPKVKTTGLISDDNVAILLDEMFGEVDTDYILFDSPHHTPDDNAEKQTLKTFEDLKETISKFTRLALIGDPGCGKTTTLQRLALDLAESARKALSNNNSMAPLPLLVSLGDFRSGPLDDYLAAQFSGLSLEQYLPYRVVVLLDGLNETAQHNVDEVARWLKANPEVRVIVACRKLDYVERQLDLQRLDVLPLDVVKIRQFIANFRFEPKDIDALYWGLAGTQFVEIWQLWSSADYGFKYFWTEERISSEDPLYKVLGPKKTSIYNTMRAAMIQQNRLPGLLGLVSNPFLLTLTIRIFHRERAVPRNRAELFRRYIAHLMEQRGKLAIIPGEREWIDEEIQQDALIALAIWLQSEQKQTFVREEEIFDIFVQFLESRGLDAGLSKNLSKFAVSANILEKNLESMRFSHQLLQEYFAAYGMGQDMSANISPSKYFPDDRWWKVHDWDESAVLLTGMSVVPGSRNADAWRVIEWLAPINPLVAWRCIVENGLDENQPTARLIKEPQISGRIAPLVRAQWGDEVAENDPRPGVGLLRDLPEIAWCKVEGGPFIYQREKVDPVLPTFYISKYPITYKQYQAFIDARDGYKNPKWWDILHPDGLSQQTNGPQEQYFKVWNRPREMVSWYEAMAFCAWLTERSIKSRQIEPSQRITLPTEVQWEKAARGTDGRPFSYGDAPNETKCNVAETGIGQTSAVGIFTDPTLPYGVCDMMGNVLEWTLTEFETKDDSNIGSDIARVVRGGSYFNEVGIARCRNRGDVLPYFAGKNIGFRVVLNF